MTPQEAEKVINTLKEEGKTEEEILGAFYKMFQEDKITIERLEGLVEAIGYHLTEEFKAMSPEEQKTKGYEEIEDEDGEGIDEDDFKEIPEDDNKDNDNDDEDKAMSLFNLKK